ncbi:norsolorinic acid ketoreductase-like protein [Elsinoe australis]|uniref:Norsolorinic acid ketoreductase-like protein n=1 Tax=Elsinoe australis TaxID=40998 RepID=A0A4U7ATG5_9PEZI|nr:norsolorinic acid ketoreductase-like protein [Elsinoe australis]
MSGPVTYLITGAGRGIGHGFASKLLRRPSTIVIAAVRNVDAASPALKALPVAEGSRLIVVKLDSTKQSDAETAVTELQERHGLSKVDVVVANAGIYTENASILDTSLQSMRNHFEVNAIAPVILLRALKVLLQKSNAPLFVGISSYVGSIGGQKDVIEFGNIASPYGASKAALNWFVHRLHLEEHWLTAFTFNPGLVSTDMGKGFTGGVDPVHFGGSTVEDSVNNMLTVMDEASREKVGGKFLQYNGTELPF